MNFTDIDLRDIAHKKLREAKEVIKKWELVLDASGEKPTADMQFNLIPPIQKKSKLTTLDKIILAIKNADCPLTSTYIMETINTNYPNKTFTMDSFSGTFSLLYREPKAGIRQYEVSQPTKTVRALYGLEEWFGQDGNFTEVYEQRAIAKYRTI